MNMKVTGRKEKELRAHPAKQRKSELGEKTRKSGQQQEWREDTQNE